MSNVLISRHNFIFRRYALGMKIYWDGKSKNIIGSRVRMYREQAKLSQRALAESSN